MATQKLSPFAVCSEPDPAFLGALRNPKFPGEPKDFHGFEMYDPLIDGCKGHVVQPDHPLPGRHWVWRTMFWDAFPGMDIAFLKAGSYVAYIEVGNTFGCPDAMKHFDVFYAHMTNEYGFSSKAALEGLSRGGLYAYRWAYVNTNRIGSIYGDAPVCDMKSWPAGGVEVREPSKKPRGRPCGTRSCMEISSCPGRQQTKTHK